MSRRSRSSTGKKSNLAVYIIVAVAVIAALIIGFLIIGKDDNPFREISRADLKEGGTSLSNNTYRVTGRISEKRLLSENRGVLIFVKQDEKIEDAGMIPIHMPSGVSKINLEKGLGYVFTVKIDDAGLPVASDVKAQ